MTLDPARLRSFPIFADVSQEDAERIAAWCQLREASPGDRLTSEGASGYALFLIDEGTADAERDGVRIGSLAAGDFFGEIALLGESSRRMASVVATSPMRLAVMFGTEFRRLEAELPEVAEQMRARMKQRLEEAGLA